MYLSAHSRPTHPDPRSNPTFLSGGSKRLKGGSAGSGPAPVPAAAAHANAIHTSQTSGRTFAASVSSRPFGFATEQRLALRRQKKLEEQQQQEQQGLQQGPQQQKQQKPKLKPFQMKKVRGRKAGILTRALCRTKAHKPLAKRSSYLSES